MLLNHQNGLTVLCWSPDANGKLRLCLDLAWLNKVLIRPFHRGLTLNDILPRVAFGSYRYIWISFGVAHDWEMTFQRKHEWSFSRGCQVCLALWITFFLQGLMTWAKTMMLPSTKILRICRQANLKLNKDKCFFWCTSILFFGEADIEIRSEPRPQEKCRQCWLTMPPPKCEKKSCCNSWV